MSQKILVVEDEPFMLRLIQHTLEKAGYEMIPARTGEEARAALENVTPNLVLGDANVVGSAVEKARLPIPVICVTDVPPTCQKSTSHAADLVLTKPFSPTKLVAEVKRLIPREAEQTIAP